MYYKHYSDISKCNWPFKWFKPAEIASNGDGSLLIDYSAVKMLDNMREQLGQPIFINSAYRDPHYNAKIGGSPLSQHKKGNAFDISLNGQDKWQIALLAKQIGFTGFGYYHSFLHIDTGRKRSWGKWE